MNYYITVILTGIYCFCSKFQFVFTFLQMILIRQTCFIYKCIYTKSLIHIYMCFWMKSIPSYFLLFIYYDFSLLQFCLNFVFLLDYILFSCFVSVQVWCKIQDAWGWCTGMTQRDGRGREVGGGLRIGNMCTPVADSCCCMAKPVQYCKVISLWLK